MGPRRAGKAPPQGSAGLCSPQLGFRPLHPSWVLGKHKQPSHPGANRAPVHLADSFQSSGPAT